MVHLFTHRIVSVYAILLRMDREGGSFQREGLFRDMVRISFLALYVCLYQQIFIREATWNQFGMFYYFAGFNGYLLLGHYLKQGNNWNIWKTFAICAAMFVVGYAITYCGFSSAAANPEATELIWSYFSPSVVRM